MPSDDNKVLIAVYVPPRVREALRRMAANEGRPVSNYVARHLIAHVSGRRPRKALPIDIPAQS